MRAFLSIASRLSSLSCAFFLFVSAAGLAQEVKPATGASTQEKTQTIDSVEVTARREALRNSVASFVATITRADGSGLGRWRAPICPWVAGASTAQNDFIRARVSEIATSAGARASKDAKCKANLLVFLTDEPDGLVALLRDRSPRIFSNAPLQETSDFFDTVRPVRVWQNSLLQNADGSSPVVHDQKSPEYRLRDSHIVSSVAEELAAVIVVVDTARTGGATFGQLADYIAMVALVRVDLDAHPGDAPTILRLFADTGLGRLTAWDQSFLKAVYGSGDSYLQERTTVTARMVQDLALQD